MKKPLLLLFLLAGILSKAQDWKPVRYGDVYLYYTNGHGFDSTSVCLKADSFHIVNGDTTFYLNTVMQPGPSVPGYFLVRQPQLLMRQLTYNSDGSFTASDTATLQFYPHAALSTPWMFHASAGITAMIVSATQQSVFGVPDSVETLLLSGGDTIVLSKSFGVLRFPDARYPGASLRLAGITGRNAGITVPGVFSVYGRLQPGDVLEYHERSFTNNYPTPNNGTHSTWIFDSLLTRTASGDTLTLVFDESRLDTADMWWSQYSGVYTTLHSTVTKRYINRPGDDLNQLNHARLYHSSAYTVSDQLLRYDSSAAFQCRTLVIPDLYEDTTRVYGPDSTGMNNHSIMRYQFALGDGRSSGTWAEGIGVLETFFYFNAPANHYEDTLRLVSCVLNGVPYGIAPWHPAAAQQQVSAAFAYPNPCASVLHYQTTFGTGTPAAVYDQWGRCCTSAAVDAGCSIDISSLPHGFYTLRIAGSQVIPFVRQ